MACSLPSCCACFSCAGLLSPLMPAFFGGFGVRNRIRLPLASSVLHGGFGWAVILILAPPASFTAGAHIPGSAAFAVFRLLDMPTPSTRVVSSAFERAVVPSRGARSFSGARVLGPVVRLSFAVQPLVPVVLRLRHIHHHHVIPGPMETFHQS